MADAIEKALGYAGRNERARKKRLRSAVGHFATKAKRRAVGEFARLNTGANTIRENSGDGVLPIREPKHGENTKTPSMMRVHDTESLFLRQNDYWTIRYDGHAAMLKFTRGLDYLAILLRNPGREFHVGELLRRPVDPSTPFTVVTTNKRGTGGLNAGVPVLDAKAKAELKFRLNDLRQELNEAERFNDSHRKIEAQNELEAIVNHLASAVGLGGRDRKTSSDAERARSAVTKCIKKAIGKVGDAIPSLGYHLAARIRTGYFCCYNPRPDRPVAWKL